MAESRKLRMGMVGGGPGAFIGPVHRLAAEMDGKIQMVAGAFSQSPERSRQAGVTFGIDPERAYASYQEMITSESKRPDGIDFIVITTPNHLHLPIALAAIEAGIPVMSDKPATATYPEAEALKAAVVTASPTPTQATPWSDRLVQCARQAQWATSARSPWSICRAG
jgi:predicted dehydrogenase